MLIIIGPSHGSHFGTGDEIFQSVTDWAKKAHLPTDGIDSYALVDDLEEMLGLSLFCPGDWFVVPGEDCPNFDHREIIGALQTRFPSNPIVVLTMDCNFAPLDDDCCEPGDQDGPGYDAGIWFDRQFVYAEHIPVSAEGFVPLFH